MEEVKVRNVIDSPLEFQVHEGISIAYMIEKCAIPNELLPQIVVLNHGIELKEWEYVTHAGDQLTICIRPSGGGGGGGGGKGVLGAIASVAIVVAAVALAAPTGGASLWLAGATGFSAATASAILTVGFTMVGMMAVSALIPPPSTNGQTGTGDTGTNSYQESQGYSLSGQSNQSKLYQPIPVIYGCYKVYPNVCATPRVNSLGKSATLAVAYDFGLGDVDVTDIRIGDQTAGELGSQISIFQNSNSPSFSHISNIQAFDQFQYGFSANSLTIRTKTNTNSAVAVFSLPRGLCYYNDQGNPQNTSFQLKIEWRPVGGSWQTLSGHSYQTDGISIYDEVIPGTSSGQLDYLCSEGEYTYVNPGTKIAYGIDGVGTVTQTIAGGSFSCDNSTFGDPLPGSYKYCYLDSRSSTPSTYTGYVLVNGSTTRPNTFNVNLNFPSSGEYEIRITRPGTVSNDNRTVNDLTLAQLKSYKVGNVLKLDHKHTMIELYAQASDRLTGVVQNLSAICYKKIRYCNASGWSGYGRTSNPAYIALDILTHEANPQPLTDNQIDFQSFSRLASICDTQVTRFINGKSVTFTRFTFNGILDQQLTVQEAVNNVLSNGRAQLCIMPSGKFGVLIDEEKTVPKQLVTPANSWSFNGNRNFPIYPDALRVSFVEPSLQWARGEIIVYADGKDASNSEIFETLELNGITSYAQAWCQGRFYMAEGRFRSETYSVTMDVENLVVIRGDLIAVQHDVPKMGGLACRVKDVSGATITLDQEFALTANSGYTVRLSDGTIKTGSIASSTSNTVTLSSGDPSISYDDLFVIGERDKVTRNYLVLAIEPANDLTATLTLVPYIPEVYQADQTAIPDWNPGFGADLISGTDLADVKGTSSQYITYEHRYPYANIQLDWQTTGNIGTLKYHQIFATLPDGTRELIGKTEGNQFIWNIDLIDKKDWWNKNIKFEVIPFNTLGIQGKPAIINHVLLPDSIKPITPEGYGVNIVNNSLVEIFWHKSRSIDIDHYEVRYSPEITGADWNMSQRLALVNFETTRTTAGARTGTYMLQAIDTSGNRSDVLSLRTSVETLPALDLVHIVDESSTWPGTLQDMTKLGGISPIIDGGFGSVKPRGIYEYQEVFDAGTVDELRIQSLIKGFGITADDVMATWIPLNIARPLARAQSSDYDVWLEVSTADFGDVMASPRWVPLSNVIPLQATGSNWNAWRRIESADVTGRFFKFRIVCESYNPNVNVKLVSSKVEIDVLERTFQQSDINVTNAAGGYNVSFSPPFRSIPSVAITIDGNTHSVVYEIVSKTNSAMNFRLLDSTTGTPVTGKADVMALGWGKIRTTSI